MDAISYSLADKQKKRIERIVSNPDSNTGIVTIPKVIPSGESVTIPEGRMAVLPNVQVDGELNINGEVFVPSGANFSDLENQISLKADQTYVDNQLSTKQNNLVANDPAVKTALNASGDAPIFTCRAWINFDGTNTVSIRASGNVSSITDNGTGDYTVSFAVAMPDANYSMTVSARNNGDSLGAWVSEYGDPSTQADRKTNSIRIRHYKSDGSLADNSTINLAFFR